MPLIWAGVLLLVLRGCEIGPMATWSWLWVVAPFAAAFMWFELFEPLFGLNREPDVGRRLQDERRKRSAAAFEPLRARRRRASRAAPPDDTPPP
jgi:small Trp-rich protein